MPFRYSNLANYALAVQRFDEAQKIIQQAQLSKLDDAARQGTGVLNN
jgi:hypothetical protein